MSFGLISLLFGAIYKVLPDKNIEWHDVMIGAIVTALLFTIGKSLISLYIGSSAVASSYGAAGSLIVCTAVDILLGPNIFARRGIHQGLCQSPWQSPGQPSPSALIACRTFASASRHRPVQGL